MDNYSKPGMTQEQLQNIRESYGLDGILQNSISDGQVM